MTPDHLGKVLAAPADPGLLPCELERIHTLPRSRVHASPDSLEKGLARLVLTIVELLRDLMERQALRRIEGGTLSDDEVERLGVTFLELAQRMEQLKQVFGLSGEDLNLHLGPPGDR